MKTLFKLLLIVVLAGYLIYAFIRTTGKEDPTVCTGVQVTFTDTLHSGFITVDEVCRLLKTVQLDPVGLLMDSVDGQKIIKTLEANSFIKSVECYKSPNGIVNLNVTQRLPILRVMPEGRDAYYIDEDGLKMVERQYNANLVVAARWTSTPEWPATWSSISARPTVSPASLNTCAPSTRRSSPTWDGARTRA